MSQQKYTVSGSEPQAGGPIVFTFVPANQDDRPSAAKPPAQFVVSVHGRPDDLAFDWSLSPSPPDAEKSEIQDEIALRVRERHEWIERVSALVDQVESWGRDLGWATKRLEKKLDDAWVGTHRVPALLMQEGVLRVLLEPVGRSAPGASGVVDLYLLPAYDDIASIYHYDGEWRLHYSFPDSAAAASDRDAPDRPLSKETLAEVLDEMKQHAH